MKVRELKALLAEMDDEAEVWVGDSNDVETFHECRNAEKAIIMGEDYWTPEDCAEDWEKDDRNSDYVVMIS